jgi:hypothetical protein
MRQRLTSRIAEDLTVKSKGDTKESKGSGIDNDVYDMNDTGHAKNDPKREQYAKGDPSAWGEDVYGKPVNKDDQNREETGHAPLVDKHAASEAIATVRALEEKAARCIVASQRCLPGADRSMIEDQAASFMHLPDEELNATLTRQEKLARMIAVAADGAAEDSEDGDDAEDEDKKEEDKKEEDKDEGDEPKSQEAGKKKDDEELPDFLQKKLASLEAELASFRKAAFASAESSKATEDEDEGKDDDADESKETESKKSKKSEKETDDEEVTFDDDEEDTEKEASDSSLLDQIFNTVTASSGKKGARTLSGLVKKEASSASADLDSILMEGAPPSVNHLFN